MVFGRFRLPLRHPKPFFPILVAVFLMVLLTKVASFLGLTGRSVDGGGGDFKGPDGDGGGD